jgi:hypothetical protein
VVGSAPTTYAAVNGLALALLAPLVLAPGERRTRAIAPIITLAAVVLLAATLTLGPVADGVRRWISLGPLQLHAGMLAIPALAAVLPRQRETVSFVTTALCAAIIWAQPDFAAALALFAAIAFATAGQPLGRAEHAMRLAAVVGLVMTAFRPDPLAGVRFVETAIGDGWSYSPLLGAVMAIALGAAIILPPRLLVQGRPEMAASGRAVTGAMAGFTLAALLASFPQPLVGFGASSILGYGLALAVLRFSR